MTPQPEGHSDHISQQFNAELEEVKNQLLEMGGAVEQQLSDALLAITSADSGIAGEVLVQEDVIDTMEIRIDEECNLILARRQPAASDLRLVLTIIKTVRDLERIGDESSKIARMAIKLAEEGDFPEGIVEFRHLGDRVARMVNLTLDAFARYDAEAALEIVHDDLVVDNEYGSAMRSLITYMMEDPRSIGRMLNLLWALRALERIGDHAKNISEHVIYLVKAMDVRHAPLANIAEKISKQD